MLKEREIAKLRCEWKYASRLHYSGVKTYFFAANFPNRKSSWIWYPDTMGSSKMPGRNIAMLRNNVLQAILASKWLILWNLISREPVVVWSWLTPHSKRKHRFLISVSHNVYHFSEQKWLNLAFWLKKAENGNIAYLRNHWSNDDGWPLILIRRFTFYLSIQKRNRF